MGGGRRFNMPLEAGLAFALSLGGQLSGGRAHEPFVLEAEYRRLQKSCSDLNGIDPCIHRHTVRGVLRGLLQMYRGSGLTVAHLSRVYRELRTVAAELKRSEGVVDIYDADVFTSVSYAAIAIARRQGFSPSR